MARCKRCGQDIIWPQPYTAGDRPLEADGSGPHDCPAYRSSRSPSSSDNGAGGGGGSFVQKTQQQQQAHPTPEEWNALFDKISKMSETMTMQAKFYEDLVTEMQTVSKTVHKSFLIQDKADQFLEQSRISDAKVDRILARVDSIVGIANVREDANSRLRRQEEEYDRDKEDGTTGGFGNE